MLETICEVMLDAYKRNWITSRDGNVSIRHHDRDHFYITPSGVRKQTMQPDQFKKILIKSPYSWNETGTGLLAERWGWKELPYTDISANLKPSGEIPLHFGLQKQMGQHIGEVRVVVVVVTLKIARASPESINLLSYVITTEELTDIIFL
jgi:L-fuculose-phosphate aldolase